MKKASLEEILAYREKRVRLREKLLAEYPFPLACLGLNIPGEYKDFPWARRSFHEEIEIFLLALEAEGITVLHEEREEENSGYTACISAGAAPESLKAIALGLEENHPLGRLFDIDIYDTDGKKLSRGDRGSPPRPCLVCGGNGFVCARSRAHTPESLRASTAGIMADYLRQKLGDRVSSAAMWAMMTEAAITPKPGLVDRFNSGSHTDMDFFAFIDSASALLPWFRDCAIAGFDSGTGGYTDAATDPRETNPKALFEALRAPGRMAEVLMKRASGGVNTHRGYVFCLGLLSAAYGRLWRITDTPRLPELTEFVKAMTVSLEEDFSRGGEMSHGRRVYAESGMRGIRGEASRGFPAVMERALPLLCRMLNEGYSLNDAGTAVLLTLMTCTEDSNIIYRGGKEVLCAIREELRVFFAGSPDINAVREKAAALDREFILKNLSPGGSADLLGVSFFLHRLFEGRHIDRVVR